MSFIVGGWDQHTTQGEPVTIRCPGCGATHSLLRLGGNSQHTVRLWLDAENPLPTREPVDGFDLIPDEKISPALKTAYRSALNVFAIGEAEATAVTCRRALEGITAGVLGEAADNHTLARRIRLLSEKHEQLAKPLIELSDVLRQGGNQGAHFNEDEPSSLDDARQMLDLLDLLITYLFVLPERVHRFRTDVLGAETAPSDAGTTEGTGDTPEP